jgi:hypothetical protein
MLAFLAELHPVSVATVPALRFFLSVILSAAKDLNFTITPTYTSQLPCCPPRPLFALLFLPSS